MKKIFSLILGIAIVYSCSTNNDGNGNSTTTVVPVTPSSLIGTVASTTQINLSWTDNSTNETGFKIERKTGTGTYAGPSGGVSTTGLNFGSRHPNGTGTANTPTDSLKGVYYQMRVYDKPLSQTEVTQNFDTIKGTYSLT
jgi:hypothetical protein